MANPNVGAQAPEPAGDANRMRMELPPCGLAEFEFDLVTAIHALHRWLVRSTAATHLKDLSAVDALVVHQIAASGSEKSLSDLSFILNIEDTHVVAYSLRKLVSMGIVNTSKQGKEVMYSAVPLAHEYLDFYRRIREACLLHPVGTLQINPAALKELAQYLRQLSGLYDQAARAVTSL